MDMKNANHEGPFTQQPRQNADASLSHRRPNVFESGLAVRTAIAAWRVQECRCRLRWPTRQAMANGTAMNWKTGELVQLWHGNNHGT